MPTMLLTVKRIDGCYLLTFLREAETGHVTISTPVGLWTRRKRKEPGGPVPRPLPEPSPGVDLAAELAASLSLRDHLKRNPEDAQAEWRVWFDCGGPAGATSESLATLLGDTIVAKHIRRVERIDS